MSNGTFLDKSPDEAFDYFNFLAESAQSWDTQNDYDRSIPNTEPFGGGKHRLTPEDDVNARLAILAKKMEQIESKSHPKANVSTICTICDSKAHVTDDCPTLPTLKKSVIY